MNVYAYEALGFEGQLVLVEVDLRRGIPCVEVIGLPDCAIRESRERIRAAIRNSGWEYPLDRILINLAPAGLRKGGAAFDLAMALALLVASRQLPDLPCSVLAMGELELSGSVRPVSGVLPAVADCSGAGIDTIIVAPGNLAEARLLPGTRVYELDHVGKLAELFSIIANGWQAACRDATTLDIATLAAVIPEPECGPDPDPDPDGFADRFPDFADLHGQPRLRRAMEICAAGGHHALLFGPPGAGKTMAALRLPGLLPPLSGELAVEATKIHSLAGQLPSGRGLVRGPVFRAPHHSASAEGLLGGGRNYLPGEISLAHGGILFLDEAPEFRSDVLQALREPLESGAITISRADRAVRYPSRFILVLACNPCPCGNLGRPEAVCLCSSADIQRYWKRLGAPLLDRVDLRVPVQAPSGSILHSASGESSSQMRRRVRAARERQLRRFRGTGHRLNGQLDPAGVDRFCKLAGPVFAAFQSRAEAEQVSGRAWHSVLRVARTIADLDGHEEPGIEQVEEAWRFRRYGDADWFWQLP